MFIDYSDIWKFIKWLKEIDIEIKRIFNALIIIDLKDFKNGIGKNYEIIDVKVYRSFSSLEKWFRILVSI